VSTCISKKILLKEPEIMSDVQNKTGNKRLQVFMPEVLMQHIEKRIGPDGMYANAGEFLRDLVRKDAQREPSLQNHLDAVWDVLLPGAMAQESEFKPLNLQDIFDENGLSK